MDYVMIGPYQFDRDASKDDMRLDYCSSFQEVALDESSLSFDTVSVEVCTTTIGAQLSALPNNTPIIVYRGGEIKARFVSSGVSRIGPVTYQLTGRSPMGALTGMVHTGGLYTGQTVEDVVKEICGNIPSLIKSVYAGVKLYGWLPYADGKERSARDNLAQVLFAIGAYLRTDLNGVLRIEPLWDGTASLIDVDRSYTGGTVKYDSPISAVTVTEHQYVAGTEVKELFSGTAQNGDIITFSEPMHSLSANGFTILESGANYAKISAGAGALTGKAYIHNTRLITQPVTAGAVENIKSVTDATLVSLVNSYTVAKRLANYYRCRETITNDIVSGHEKPGHVVSVYHPYDKKMVSACIQSLDTTMSATLKSSMDALVGFTPAQPEAAAVKYYPINEGAARRANDANSFRDYTPGSATAVYRQMVDEAAELAQNQKSRVDPMHHERIDQLLDTYARRLAENMNNSYAIEARVPSILIAGGSNFPVRKKEKQNAARDRNMEDWQDVQGILDKIRSTGMGGISADDPQAVAKLEAKLAKLEAAQETMKGVNAYYRKHGTLEGCTLLKPEQIKELQEGMAQSWHLEKNKPFQSFELSNNNAEIRRIRGRIEQLKQHEEKSFEGWEFDGGRVEANKTGNRLQIFFDEKPDDAARAELKANGFKWAPSAGAWQRQLNNNAYYAAGYVSCIQPITGEKPIDLQRKAQHQQAAPTPDNLLTGEQITTPRGSFHLTSMSVEQMREAGYGIHHTSEDGKYHIMGNGTQAFAVAVEQPENYLKAAEMSTEQNYNMIDQQINNTPSVDELEEKAKRGELVSLSALAAAVKAEDGKTPQRGEDGKKPSIRAQLKADQQQAAKTQKQDKEKKRSIKKDLEME